MSEPPWAQRPYGHAGKGAGLFQSRGVDFARENVVLRSGQVKNFGLGADEKGRWRRSGRRLPMSAFGGTEVCSDSTHHKTWGARVYRRVLLNERRKYPSGDPLGFFSSWRLARHTCAVSCGRVNSKWGQRLGASARGARWGLARARWSFSRVWRTWSLVRPFGSSFRKASRSCKSPG